tara:strand:- start:51972 stop:52079 length:108 start_codon:yes stop_codon:yes gene_type:complete
MNSNSFIPNEGKMIVSFRLKERPGVSLIFLIEEHH